MTMPSGAQLAVAISDWMDPETDDPLYRLQDPPRLSANRTMLVASELSSVAGMSSEAWLALAPYVTAYPAEASPIDLERSADLMKEVFADRTAGDGAPWFMRLQIVAQFGDRRFSNAPCWMRPTAKWSCENKRPVSPDKKWIRRYVDSAFT